MAFCPNNTQTTLGIATIVGPTVGGAAELFAVLNDLQGRKSSLWVPC